MNDAEIVARSIEIQKQEGLRLNPKAAIQARIYADGYTIVHNEAYDGVRAFQGAENLRTGERRVYLWAPGKGVWWIPGRPGDPKPPPPPTPLPTGTARFGLHASADPDITQAEIDEFATLRPGIIKLLTINNAQGVAALAKLFPGSACQWIVRPMVSFIDANGGLRHITPEQFYHYTIEDLVRTVDILRAYQVPVDHIFVEIHNEPNLITEGFGNSWTTPAQFAEWFLYVVSLYMTKLPYGCLFPGLSPGNVEQVRPVDQWTFLDQCRYTLGATGVAGVGVHAYWWGATIDEGLGVATEYARQLPRHRLWVTEASNNKAWGVDDKARQYVQFAGSLPRQYEGVTYFVASAINPRFKNETWVGKNMAKIVSDLRVI